MKTGDPKRIKTMKKVYPQIYSYELPTLHDHNGWQKIGYTERKDVDERIREQTKTAAIQLDYHKLWSASAVFANDDSRFFTDKDLHKYYIKNGITRSEKQGNGGFGEEWFYFGDTPEESKTLFNEYAKRDFSRQTERKTTYSLRHEQEKAVLSTLEYAAEHQTTDFETPNERAKYLWNAKPRFGKTLASYDFAKRFKARNVLIVTNRPAIANSWYDDFEKFVEDYYFISTTDSLKERPALSRSAFINRANPTEDDRQITFLSLQDLKGGKVFGGKYDKLEWVADLNWDLLIIDEAHEGVDTERTDEAFKKIKRRFTLHLSGTPFKAIADGYFADNQIFNWTYVDEQKAKADELKHGNDAGAHVNLPDMRLFTYKMSEMIESRLSEGMELDDTSVDYAFELNDMFETDDKGKFIHEAEIVTFLDQLTINEKYPFSTPEMRDELKHTFWLVGNRVASAKAMERLLSKHPVFSGYKVILAAGDGKPVQDMGDVDSAEADMQNISANEKSYDRVKRAIRENERTITLSVGQLTTGVTVEEWSAVIMLSDIKSESLYTQAIFRAQNPYRYVGSDGNLYRKESAYVFDFSPNRVLKVYDKFANSLFAKTTQDKITDKEREQNVAELLNYFPVLAEDKDGKMVELDAEQVLTFPEAIVVGEIVKRGFVSNLLFANVSNIFRIPQEVIDSLNKAQSTNDSGRKQSKPKDINHDPKRKDQRDKRISVNKEKILGDKVYSTRMQRVVEEAVRNAGSGAGLAEKITADYADEVSEPFARYREVYAPTKSELEQFENQHLEKVREIAEEFVAEGLETKESQLKLAEKLSELVEKDLANDLVVSKEEEKYKKEEASEMDQIRQKLRTFTKAIPTFVMASEHPEELTLDNIEDTVSDEDFDELFTEKFTQNSEPFTKEDFRKIRGPWTNPETEEVFEGFFDRHRFNAAIKEFEEKRKAVVDYLQPEATEDIFDYVRPLKTNQIFTPRRVVNQMLDLLEEHDPGIFKNPDLKFCDLYVKSGLYLAEIAKKLNQGLEEKIPDKTERVRHIFEKQLYGFAPTSVIYNIARKFVYGVLPDYSGDNLKRLDLTGDFMKGETRGMKFDVVIGNPPYNDNIEGRGDQPSIYNYFLDAAYDIADVVCMIHPARFLFNVGNTSTKWNRKMLDDEYLRVVMFEQKSNVVFPNTDIKGGVAITLRDAKKKCGKIGTFTHYKELNSILKKVAPKMNLGSLAEIYYSTDSYHFTKTLHDEHPDAKQYMSKGHEYDVKSSIFERFSDLQIFTDNKVNDDDVQFIGLIKLKRVTKYIKNEYVKEHPNLDKWKVILPGSNGSGALGEALSTPFVGQPLVGHTQTFISLGAFENEAEAKNLLKYIKTKFARTMLGTLKITQSNKRGTWTNTPMQDFTNDSDIDWSKSVAEIDRRLYEKYDLDKDEIEFIEEKVTPME